MDYEEKLEEAKRLYQTVNADQKYVLERLFPELKKFKVGDTIIKKHNSDINKFGQFTITNITGGKYWYNDRIICDISEQYEWELVEQKPTNEVEPKFKIGDFIVNDYCFGKVIEITNDAYLLDTGQGIPFSCEHNAHLWTIQDAKEGDVLVDVYENIGIYQQHDDFDWTSYCSLGFHGGFQNFKVEHENDKTHPAAKEQRDQLEKAMADAGWEFDFEKKELKKIEQKLTWSEEDNLMLQSIIQDYVSKYEETHFDSILKKLDWLKSLKDRIQPNQWKPSKEQIETLEYYMLYLTDCKQKEVLFGLYDQLKKLNNN